MKKIFLIGFFSFLVFLFLINYNLVFISFLKSSFYLFILDKFGFYTERLYILSSFFIFKYLWYLISENYYYNFLYFTSSYITNSGFLKIIEPYNILYTEQSIWFYNYQYKYFNFLGVEGKNLENSILFHNLFLHSCASSISLLNFIFNFILLPINHFKYLQFLTYLTEIGQGIISSQNLLKLQSIDYQALYSFLEHGLRLSLINLEVFSDNELNYFEKQVFYYKEYAAVTFFFFYLCLLEFYLFFILDFLSSTIHNPGAMDLFMQNQSIKFLIQDLLNEFNEIFDTIIINKNERFLTYENKIVEEKALNFFNKFSNTLNTSRNFDNYTIFEICTLIKCIENIRMILALNFDNINFF